MNVHKLANHKNEIVKKKERKKNFIVILSNCFPELRKILFRKINNKTINAL